MHELREMLARVDDKKMQLFPVKLKAEDKTDLPPEAASLQYMRFSDYASAEELVDKIVTRIKT